MRRYRGKYPRNICLVSGTGAHPGVVFIRTNDGACFSAYARDNALVMPQCGVPIERYVANEFSPMRRKA